MLFSECPPIYVSCMTISGGRTEQLYIIAGFLPRHWLYEWFSSAECPPIYASCVTISGGRTEHVIIAGFLLRHWFYKWFYPAEQPSNTL